MLVGVVITVKFLIGHEKLASCARYLDLFSMDFRIKTCKAVKFSKCASRAVITEG